VQRPVALLGLSALSLSVFGGCARTSDLPAHEANAAPTVSPRPHPPRDIVALVSNGGRCTSARLVESLPASLIRAHGRAGLETIRDAAKACEGVAAADVVERPRPGLSIALAEPVDASLVAGFLGAEDPFLVSTAERTRSFQLASSFHPAPVRFGAWFLRTSAVGAKPVSVVTHVSITMAD
jgi:hypothetical protein